MTPVREAFILPGLFLTVSLLGGFRVAEQVRLVPPPLASLVVAMLLVGALARARVFEPYALLSASRSTLENLCGIVVLLTLFGASAQVITAVTPDRGLLHAIFTIGLFVQLLGLGASGAARAGTLRSLLVILGSAFVLRFIVLEALYAKDQGLLARVLTVLVSGATLGTIDYQPHAAITGYVAFATLCLYMIGLVLLPVGTRHDLVPSAPRTDITVTATAMVMCVAVLSGGCSREGKQENPATVGEAKASEGPSGKVPGSAGAERAMKLRDEALRSARVWRAPSVPPSKADLGSNPAGEFRDADEVTCRFRVEAVGGLTPKFNCELPNGEVVKVKYGATNPELHAEVAATRLLNALGFGADRMFVVRKVRCAGCPPFPFSALRCLAGTGLERACFPTGIDFNRVSDIDPAVIERRLEGRKIEGTSDQGWAWYELDKIDPAHGGSPRAEVDALRLLAVFLGHWDNKAENQRLICLPDGDRPDGGCTRPFALIQDTGATFGPLKIELHNWQKTPMWVDAAACTVTMKQLPWGGGTFPDAQISEEGRLFLLRLLEQLSAAQLDALFTTSRVTQFASVDVDGRNPRAWVQAFQDKVRQIREAGPCPGVTKKDG